ncbi:hypothetical protein JOQ06_023912, partial [Pogonophryne albipinna]
MASNQTNRRNAVRFDLLEDLQMDRLQFSRHILQKELDFASNHLEYIFAYPGKKIFEVIFTTSQHFQNCLERFEKKKTSASGFDKISMTPLAERDLKTYVMIFSEKVRNQDVWTWMTRHCECNLCSSENHRFKDCPYAYSNRVKLSPFETPETREEERTNEEPELSPASRSGTNQEPTNNVSQQPIQEPIQDQEKETSESESIIDWSADTVEDIIGTTYIPLPMTHATGKQVLRKDPPDKPQASVPLVLPIAINQIKDARDSPSRKRPQESSQSDEPSLSYGDSPSPTSNPLLEPEDDVVEEIVGVEQTCAIPGRSMNDSLALIGDSYLYTIDRKLPLCISGLDLEKAFDRINHQYLKEVL